MVRSTTVLSLALLFLLGTSSEARNTRGGGRESRAHNTRGGREADRPADARRGGDPKPQAATDTYVPPAEEHSSNRNNGRNNRNRNRRSMNGGGGGGGMSYGGGNSGRSKDNDDCYTVRIKVTNLARGQPLSEFYVHAHNELSFPLYSLGEPATAAFQTLAEEGNARDLVQYYHENNRGVFTDSIRIEGGSQPLEFGEDLLFRVEVKEEYPYVSFAAMAINTNDAFIGVAGMRVDMGTRLTVFVPGYDAGTEMNNELCEFIPGPACNGATGNLGTGEGEGVVYIHPGISGMTEDMTPSDLSPAMYDWRNPMVKIEVMAEEETHYY